MLTPISASMFNHSSTPNVNYIRQPKTSTIVFRTSRAVAEGEELCICYTADESKLWFNPSGSARRVDDKPEDEEAAITAFAELALDNWFERAEVEVRAAKTRARQERLHSARKTDEVRKKKAQPSLRDREENAVEDGMIHSPQPVQFSTSVIPELPTYPLAEQVLSELPAPLHSDTDKTSRHEHVGPVVLTPELDWRAEDWVDDGEGVDDWDEVVRVKGAAEEGDKEDEDALCE